MTGPIGNFNTVGRKNLTKSVAIHFTVELWAIMEMTVKWNGLRSNVTR
jgi:hypothetical protein